MSKSTCDMPVYNHSSSKVDSSSLKANWQSVGKPLLEGQLLCHHGNFTTEGWVLPTKFNLAKRADIMFKSTCDTPGNTWLYQNQYDQMTK